MTLTDHYQMLIDLCGGILGADDDDRISEIRVHFTDRPSMYLRNALAMTLDAIEAERRERPNVDGKGV